VLLLMHDLRLDRTTNGRGWLADCPLETLRGLDAGQGQQIPTLEEALDLVEGRIGVNIEIKNWGGTGTAVATLLREYLAAGYPAERLLVSSFHLPELWDFKQTAPEVPVAALVGGVPLDWAACGSELEAVALHFSGEFVDERLIADAKSRGLRTHVYTVNDPADARALQSMGVDGVFSDYPDRLLAALRGQDAAGRAALT
jgi:glycerophosphoryl diester phosphodiesterase